MDDKTNTGLMEIIEHRRNTDPATSEMAAKKMVNTGRLQTQCASVLAALRKFAPCTGKELALLSGLSYDIIRRRLSDLGKKRLAETTGMVREGAREWEAHA